MTNKLDTGGKLVNWMTGLMELLSSTVRNSRGKFVREVKNRQSRGKGLVYI